jgi:hypothetical protein
VRLNKTVVNPMILISGRYLHSHFQQSNEPHITSPKQDFHIAKIKRHHSQTMPTSPSSSNGESIEISPPLTAASNSDSTSTTTHLDASQ